MKKQVLIVIAGAVVVCLANSVQAQGTIQLNNYDSFIGVYLNGLTTPAPTTVFVEVLGGATAGSLTPVLSTTLGTANIPITDPEGASGSFFDGGFGVVNGVGGGGTAFLEVIAWMGGTSLATATYEGQSAIWSQTIGTVVPAPPSVPTPASILIPGTGVIVTPVPEPTTLALAGLGGLSLLLFRRRK